MLFFFKVIFVKFFVNFFAVYYDFYSSGGICLDDLFKKTKTTPSIYWLPLTDEEIKSRDDAREERKKAREERRKASEERKVKARKRSRR